ncbi:tail fiber assembly protein [Pantoea sp. Bo_2]|uniref:tail fiber assembly protein n=1 Tax=unclassified Pantoea TaxID=2630326 RepID=UPI001231B669|nr:MULTISPECIES: tail fiber assembly protein [unclassified Pantoea]KAA5935115.1 tail fiber assembly protein [Pantoea sp. VH_3]KAA5945707.1 tail fiber assembly protein [Pantoea sp. VH_25]KAA5976731.1 tail fiber assembly protein [Pantoea sp. M_3]KAA6039340.1 tail fiber assembly protein [Pantoea sp. FN_2b]KAA6043990.1 tail fiber assembly protein [Pantoea sp. Bo_5]
MDTIYYSAKNNGFYHSELEDDYKSSPDGWPSDAVAVSDEQYKNLLQGQVSGKVIAADSDGNPTLTDPVIDWQAKAESQRQSLLSAANTTIILWQTKLLAGKQLSEEQKKKLDSWLAYMDQLEAMDSAHIDSEEKYHTIEWPVKP